MYLPENEKYPLPFHYKKLCHHLGTDRFFRMRQRFFSKLPLFQFNLGMPFCCLSNLVIIIIARRLFLGVIVRVGLLRGRFSLRIARLRRFFLLLAARVVVAAFFLRSRRYLLGLGRLFQINSKIRKIAIGASDIIYKARDKTVKGKEQWSPTGYCCPTSPYRRGPVRCFSKSKKKTP